MPRLLRRTCSRPAESSTWCHCKSQTSQARTSPPTSPAAMHVSTTCSKTRCLRVSGAVAPSAPDKPVSPVAIFQYHSILQEVKDRTAMPIGKPTLGSHFAARVFNLTRIQFPCPAPRGSAAFAPGQRSIPRSHAQRLARWQATQGFLRPSSGCVTRPQEAATLQPLREQAHALPVMPENLDQPTAAATEHKQMATL